MTNHLTDRLTGVLLFLFALGYGYRATVFKVGFLSDPLGPKAFPILLAALMGLLSLYLIFKPDPNPEWPSPELWLRIGLITLSFIGYAYLLEPLGFIIATTLEMTVLAVIFQGPLLKSLAASLALNLGLFGLFSVVLELSLPTGRLFAGLLGG